MSTPVEDQEWEKDENFVEGKPSMSNLSKESGRYRRAFVPPAEFDEDLDEENEKEKEGSEDDSDGEGKGWIEHRSVSVTHALPPGNFTADHTSDRSVSNSNGSLNDDDLMVNNDGELGIRKKSHFANVSQVNSMMVQPEIDKLVDQEKWLEVDVKDVYKTPPSMAGPRLIWWGTCFLCCVASILLVILFVAANPLGSAQVVVPVFTEGPTISTQTLLPTVSPTLSPIAKPTISPTVDISTESPSFSPTSSPTESPTTTSPTESPTAIVLTESPTIAPSSGLTLPPTLAPTVKSRLPCETIRITPGATQGNFGDNNFKVQEVDGKQYCGDTYGPDPKRPNRNPWSVRIGRRDCPTFTYDEGIEICDTVGARWCTVEEFEIGIANATGCGGDQVFVYTSTDCFDEINNGGFGKIMFDVGLRPGKKPFYVCETDLNRKSLARCCGDFEL